MPPDHEVPTWVRPDASFFITLCARERGLNTFCRPDVGPAILDSIQWRNQQQKWFCSLALLMPDHIHLIVQFPFQMTMEESVRPWKAWLVRKHAIAWQPDFFDHRLRSETSAGEKADYILNNPLRAGLIKEARDWPYVFMTRD